MGEYDLLSLIVYLICDLATYSLGLLNVLLGGSVEVEGHSDGPDAVGWGVLVVSVVSVGAWGVSGRLLKSWLEDLVDPELAWIHAGLSAIVENVINRVVLLQWLGARVAAWSGWLVLTNGARSSPCGFLRGIVVGLIEEPVDFLLSHREELLGVGRGRGEE